MSNESDEKIFDGQSRNLSRDESHVEYQLYPRAGLIYRREIYVQTVLTLVPERDTPQSQC